MKVKEQETKPVTVIADIICDCCGKSCKNKTTGSFEYLEMKARWGYATKKDNEEWNAQICEACVDEKMSFISFEKEEMQMNTFIGTTSSYVEKMEKSMLNIKGHFEDTGNPHDTK